MLRRRRHVPAAEPTEADRQLAQARQLQQRTVDQQPQIDKITAAADREVRGNNIAMLIRGALLHHGEHT